MSGAHGALRSGAVRPKERFTLKVDDRLDVGEPVEVVVERKPLPRKAVRSRPLQPIPPKSGSATSEGTSAWDQVCDQKSGPASRSRPKIPPRFRPTAVKPEPKAEIPFGMTSASPGKTSRAECRDPIQKAKKAVLEPSIPLQKRFRSGVNRFPRGRKDPLRR